MLPDPDDFRRPFRRLDRSGIKGHCRRSIIPAGRCALLSVVASGAGRAAGALAALVPASALLLAGASVITKNVAGDAFGIATSDTARTLLTRVLVIVVALLALGVWLIAQRTVVELLLLYYNGITQFAPGVIATFLWRRATAWGVGAGIAAGLAVAIPLAALNVAPWGINAGFVGLVANVAVLVLVSLTTRPPHATSDGR